MVTLTFDEQLDPNAESAPDAFSVTVNGVPVSFRPYSWANGGRPVPALWDAVPVWINGHSVMLTLAGKVAVGHEVAVRYQQPRSGAKLQDLAGNPVAAFDATEVENRTRTSPPLIADAWSYAQETDSGYDHVLRWMRVFKTLSVLNDMTAAEAHQHANQHQPARWEPVAAKLEKLENAPGDYQPDSQLVDDVRGYAQETGKGFWHVLRWMRTLQAFGALADMTSAEAHEYANQHQAARWDPVAAELAAKEAATAEPEASVPVAPANFAVSSTVGTLDIAATWDALEGATSYRLRWRQAGGEFEPDDEITVTDTEATITVSSYGQWEIRLQACNDAGCGPEASRTAGVAGMAGLRMEPAVDAEGRALPRTITATWDPVPDAASYKLSWWRAGSNAQAQGRTAEGSSGASDQGANGQGENQLNLPGDRTSADFTVSEDGRYEAKLEAQDEDDELIAMHKGLVDVSVTARLNARLSYLFDDSLQSIGCQPRTITGIDATFHNNGVRVSWDDPSIPAITKYQYRVERGGAFTLSLNKPWTDVPNSDATTTSHTLNLAQNTLHGVWLRALAGSQSYCFKYMLWITPFDVSVPLITGFEARRTWSDNADQVSLFWDDPGVDGLTYEYWYQGIPYAAVGTWVSGPTPVQGRDGKLTTTLSGMPCRSEYFNIGIRAQRGKALGPVTRTDHIVLADHGGSGNDTLYGDSSNDCLFGWDGNDTLYGRGGNDRLNGGAGADHLDGGSGTDTADYFYSLRSGVTVNLANSALNQGEARGDTFHSIENVTGSGYSDQITGNASANVLSGHQGNDTLRGSDGNDTLNGESGNDALYGNNGNDTLNGGPGDDTLNGGPGADALDGGLGSDTADYSGSDAAVTVNLDTRVVSGGHAQGDTIASVENAAGSGHNDTLTGDASDNVLRGGPGGDALDGGLGSDTADYSGSDAAVTVNLDTRVVSGGHAQGDTIASIENAAGSAHDDTLTGDASDNVLQGRSGVDTLSGGPGTDTLWGGPGNDIINGGDGADILHGGDSDDTMWGDRADAAAGAGDDLMYGEGGRDTLHGLWGNDTLDGGNGNDTLYGGAGDDRLEGGYDNDRLEGGDGNDRLYDGRDHGNDRLEGGDGNDQLGAFWGNDTLNGGAGTDEFYFYSLFAFLKFHGWGFADNTIEDYTLGDTKAGSETIYLCIENENYEIAHSGADSGSDHVITVTLGSATVGTITLKGITSSSTNFANLNIVIPSNNCSH